MTTKPRKRSAASEVLHGPKVHPKVVLSGSHSAAPSPDKEIHSKKPVRLTRAKAASIRRAIEIKAPVASKREKTLRTHGVIGELSFVTGKIAGQTNSLIGKLVSAVKKN